MENYFQDQIRATYQHNMMMCSFTSSSLVYYVIVNSQYKAYRGKLLSLMKTVAHHNEDNTIMQCQVNDVIATMALMCLHSASSCFIFP